MKNYFIKKIKFNRDFRTYKRDEILEFKAGINLIVGEQGCGKSSLFKAIMDWQESGISMDYDTESTYAFIDTELMNPRLLDSFKAHRKFKGVTDYDKAEFQSTIDRLVNDYDIKSHGQVMLPLILSTSNESGKSIFIDEPESGLSIRSQYTIAKHFKEISKNNQLIIATHSIILMQEVGEVYSLEDRVWMKSEEFIEKQKTGKLKTEKSKQLKKTKKNTK